MSENLIASIYKYTKGLGDPHYADSPYLAGGKLFKVRWLREIGIDAAAKTVRKARKIFDDGKTGFLPPGLRARISDFFLRGGK